MPWSAESGSYLVTIATGSTESAARVQHLAESLRGPEGVRRRARPGRPDWHFAQCWLGYSDWPRAVSILSQSNVDSLLCIDEPAGRLSLGMITSRGTEWTSVARTSLRPLRHEVTGEPLFGAPLQADPWPQARQTIESWLDSAGLPPRWQPQAHRGRRWTVLQPTLEAGPRSECSRFLALSPRTHWMA